MNDYPGASQTWKEVNYLTQLINQKKLVSKAHHLRGSTSALNVLPNIKQAMYSEPISNRVYVNPNYQKKQPVIHINPQKCGKGIYLNPKLIEARSQPLQQLHPSHYSQLRPATNRTTWNLPKAPSMKANSVYVKPELIKKIVTSVENDKVSQEAKKSNPVQQNYKILSKTKLVKSVTPVKKPVTSSLVSISKRKLVKLSPKSVVPVRTPVSKFEKRMTLDKRKLTVDQMKNSLADAKVVKLSPVNKYKIDRTAGVRAVMKKANGAVSKYKVNRIVGKDRRSGSCLVSKYKVDKTDATRGVKKAKLVVISKYKVDRNAAARGARRKSDPRSKKIREKSTIVIEGQVYESSKNKLVKNSDPDQSNQIKRRRNLPVQNEQFLITKNGKKLSRIVMKTPCLSAKKSTSSASSKSTNVKNNKTMIPKRSQMKYLSTNARQRSLQLMQSKFSKNNQPCLVFRRYGYCPKQDRGTCSKVHNKNQVALCQKFLQGKCLAEDCKLSHNIGPEKMPTCKYFLEGCCSRDSCPYQHVKVSDKTPICVQFLEGYCEKGNECKNRHIFLCPEFEKTGKCSKGKSCSYPHKSSQHDKLRKLENSTKSKKHDLVGHKSKTEPGSNVIEETCKRYYNDTQNQNLAQKKKRLLSQVRVMKETSAPNSSKEDIQDYNSDNYIDSDDEIIVECARVKKPPIGTLPSFIPIN